MTLITVFWLLFAVLVLIVAALVMSALSVFVIYWERRRARLVG